MDGENDEIMYVSPASIKGRRSNTFLMVKEKQEVDQLMRELELLDYAKKDVRKNFWRVLLSKAKSAYSTKIVEDVMKREEKLNEWGPAPG